MNLNSSGNEKAAPTGRFVNFFARLLNQDLPGAKRIVTDCFHCLVFRPREAFSILDFGQRFGCGHAQGQTEYQRECQPNRA